MLSLANYLTPVLKQLEEAGEMRFLSTMMQIENGGTGGNSYTDEKTVSTKPSYGFTMVNYEEYL